MAYSPAQEPSYGSYGSLLQALQARKAAEPSRKRRKLNDSAFKDAVKRSQLKELEMPLVNLDDDLKDDGEENEKVHQEGALAGGGPEEEDDDDEAYPLEDPFAQHYVAVIEAEITQLAKLQSVKKPNPTIQIIDGHTKKTWISVVEDAKAPSATKRVEDLHVKGRFFEGAKSLLNTLTPLEKDLARTVCTYSDVVAGNRTVKNAAVFRDVCMLHCLNHVFKTRDRVLKNNTKLTQASGEEAFEARDQGFARPKVLIIAPTRQHCVRFVDSIVKLNKPEQQENKSRFLEQHSREDEDEWQEKPADFRELFGGNHDEDFRIGLKFTRKTLKYFSGFYNSDIIIASPLGLMRTITGKSKEEEDKKEDSDFLSSIEVLIVDHASALQMQNWQHVEFVFSHVNLLPKESHGCDFSRVRHWYLDGLAKYLRQTIILSTYLTPEINSLAASHLHNVAGRVKYQPVYEGAIIDVPNLLPMAVNQTFIRFDATTAVGEADARFRLFSTTMLPQLLREGGSLKGILIFVPQYLDFVRLRNHVSSSLENTAVSFGGMSEYTPVKEVNRARSHFISGRHSLLLYSERAHHHFRYRLKGVRRIIFYGVPENPVFWTEIVSLLGLSMEEFQREGGKGKGLVRALFSKWDVMKLERIVGTGRVSKLLSEKAGDTFDFV